MTDFGFDESDFPETDIEEVIEDEIPEPPAEPKAQQGDIYRLGRHRLMCGDSTLLSDVRELMNGNAADLVVTDPPYNMNYQGAGKSKDRESKKILNDKMSNSDFEKFLFSVYSNYFEVMKDGSTIYTFYKELGTGVFITALKDSALTFKQKLVWVKNQIVLGGSKYQSMFEPILMACKGQSVKIWNGKRKQRSVIESLDFMTEEELRELIKDFLSEEHTDVIREKRQAVNDLHPTMKPVRLIAYLIKNSSNKDHIVIDLFGGSGTTLIACEQCERSAYIMELDPRFIDVIIKRWETLTGQSAELVSSKNK